MTSGPPRGASRAAWRAANSDGAAPTRPSAPTGRAARTRRRTAPEPAVQPQRPAGVERRPVDADRLDREAVALEALEEPLQGLRRGVGVGHHEVEPRAARQRLAHPQAGPHPRPPRPPACRARSPAAPPAPAPGRPARRAGAGPGAAPRAAAGGGRGRRRSSNTCSPTERTSSRGGPTRQSRGCSGPGLPPALVVDQGPPGAADRGERRREPLRERLGVAERRDQRRLDLRRAVPSSARNSSSTNHWNTVGTVPRPLARAATIRFSNMKPTETMSASRSQSPRGVGRVGVARHAQAHDPDGHLAGTCPGPRPRSPAPHSACCLGGRALRGRAGDARSSGRRPGTISSASAAAPLGVAHHEEAPGLLHAAGRGEQRQPQRSRRGPRRRRAGR